ncbi:MAG: cell division protein FtsL [Gammaproteobacteria bacterium]|nr:cell division protein FtsL [Gammaproteobacteria bacterium]
MRKALVVLTILILVSSIAVVFLRHKHRVLFLALQSLQVERDRLSVQWGKLMIQEATSGQPAKIEAAAKRSLGMMVPGPTQIVVVNIPEATQ